MTTEVAPLRFSCFIRASYVKRRAGSLRLLPSNNAQRGPGLHRSRVA